MLTLARLRLRLPRLVLRAIAIWFAWFATDFAIPSNRPVPCRVVRMRTTSVLITIRAKRKSEMRAMAPYHHAALDTKPLTATTAEFSSPVVVHRVSTAIGHSYTSLEQDYSPASNTPRPTLTLHVYCSGKLLTWASTTP